MSKSSRSFSTAAVLFSLVSLSTAHADGPIATHGPPVAGVCVFGKDQALQTSKAGASATEQIRQFASAASAKLKPERDAIAQENQALMEQRASLSPGQLQQRGIALQQKTPSSRKSRSSGRPSFSRRKPMRSTASWWRSTPR